MGMLTKESVSEQLKEHLRQLDHHTREIVRGLRSTAPEEQPEFIRMIETAFKQSWSRLVGDNDLTNKRQVYAQISEFLGKHFPMPPQVCRYVCLQLCEETDAALLEEVKLNQFELAQAMESLPKVKELIVAVKVRFEPSTKTDSVRRSEIWYIRGKDIVSKSSELKLAWEDLPTDVRADYLKERKKEVTYKLYPKE